jgi:hypothetical protein
MSKELTLKKARMKPYSRKKIWTPCEKFEAASEPTFMAEISSRK